MKVLKFLLILLNLWLVHGLRDPKSIEYLEKKTNKPTLEELKTGETLKTFFYNFINEILFSVLEDSLKKNFDIVSVEIVDSPDLTLEPYFLASPYIGGDTTIIEYGNDDYLLPLVDKSKVYDLVPIIRQIESYKTKDFAVVGAGAGPFEFINQNCEGIFNMKVFANGTIINENHIVRTKGAGIEVTKVPNNETRAALLGNIFLSEGKSGKVLKVTASNRTGDENFISAMRVGLTEKYSADKFVGLGGVFVMKKGTANIHVMAPFSETPLDSDEKLNSWLTFHNFTGPLVAVGDFVSHQTDFKLRFQHFHVFSDHNEGGHYHYDITPEIVEYEGFFDVAERIILIDKNFATIRSVSLAIIALSFMITKIFH